MPSAIAPCWRSSGEQTDWTRRQAEQVLKRIDDMLELFPKAKAVAVAA